jgi:beta-lactamase class A
MLPVFLLFAALNPDLEQIAREAHGHAGAMALMLGGYGASLELRSAEHFPMQSVYKFPIGMAVLHAVDEGTLKLDQSVTVRKSELVPAALRSPLRDKYPAGECEITVRELLRYMVSESDGTASDVLLRVVGGAAKVQTYLDTIGISEVRVATTEMEMARDDKAQYRNWATPRGMMLLLRALQTGRGLSPSSRQYLLDCMTQTETGLNRILGMLPAGTLVAHKTGTSNTVNGTTAATNDVGLVTLPNGETLAVVVFVSDSPADAAVREGVIAKIARAAWDWSVSGKVASR